MSGVKSIEKGALLLTILADADGPLRLIDIASRAQMIPSMAHSYLASLVRTGLVARIPASGLYDLGETALRLGLTALTRLDFPSIAREAMTELAETGHTVLLSVWSDRGPVVIDKIESRRDSIYEIRIGSIVPAVQTATGRTFMAFLPASAWTSLVAAATIGAAEHKRLQSELNRIARERIALPRSGMMPQMPGIAAPVFDHHGAIKAVLTVLGRADSVTGDALEMMAPRMKAVSLTLSKRLGWTGASGAKDPRG